MRAAYVRVPIVTLDLRGTVLKTQLMQKTDVSRITGDTRFARNSRAYPPKIQFRPTQKLI